MINNIVYNNLNNKELFDTIDIINNLLYDINSELNDNKKDNILNIINKINKNYKEYNNIDIDNNNNNIYNNLFDKFNEII